MAPFSELTLDFVCNLSLAVSPSTFPCELVLLSLLEPEDCHWSELSILVYSFCLVNKTDLKVFYGSRLRIRDGEWGKESTQNGLRCSH